MAENIPGVGGSERKESESKADAGHPEFVIEGREDEVYHELRLPSRGNEPEYVHLDKSWTFNRAMRWLEPDNGAIICYSAGGALELTGDNRVSEWFTDPVNTITHSSSGMSFRKLSGRKRDCVVLPGFQFHLGQHPRLDLSVMEADAEWQCCAIIKGRSGPPLLSTGWRKGQGDLSLDIASAFREKGFDLNFAEINIVFGFWCQAGQKASADISIRIPAQDAVVACLPVVRTSEVAAKTGLPIAAIAIDSKGHLLDAGEVSLSANLAGREIDMRHCDGVWTADVPDVPEGGHCAMIHCGSGSKMKPTLLPLRVTQGSFISYNKDLHSLSKDGKTLGPISGSYQGMVFVENPGKGNECILQGKDVAEAELNADIPPRWHYWESLTKNEIEERISYLGGCGYDLLHLSQGWGIWEKLDAGGRIAPHGAEQLSLLLGTASRHGMALLFALTHYPYGSRHTPALAQYQEKGFQDWYWPVVEPTFTEMFHGYLAHVGKLWKDEDAIGAFSTSGEGDIAAGPSRVNDTCSFMGLHAPDHLFVSEPIHRMTRLPQNHVSTWAVPGWIEDSLPEEARVVNHPGWKQILFGSRMYWIGLNLEPEIDLGVEFKFLAMGDYFMGEGSWPCPRLYADFMGHSDTWSGTQRYRLRIRDSLYMGLVHRSPILLTWEEQFAEDEHAVLREVRKLVDWSQEFKAAPVAIRVSDAEVGASPENCHRRAILGEYEKFFSSLPLMCRYIAGDADAGDAALVIDARGDAFKPSLLPVNLADLSPLRLLSPSYRASYLWSADGRTLLAYIYNCTRHECLEGRGDLSGNWHRVPAAAPLSIELRGIPNRDKTCVRLYNLDTKKYETIKHKDDNMMIERQNAEHDYLLLMIPGNP
ncbi:MAG: hypothetical protein WAX69_12210 [Victivallales bacterium]